MGTIVISENVSLDGVIKDPGGVEGFRLGGWCWETDRGVDGENYTLDRTLDTEALLLGRRSYEFFAATWPSRRGELADKLNALPKYVVSSTLEDPGWSNSTVLRGNVLDEVSKLKHGPWVTASRTSPTSPSETRPDNVSFQDKRAAALRQAGIRESA